VNSKKLRGFEARGGAHRGMADGGGARPEFERGMGFRWPEAVVQARGAVGRGVALERRGGEEWVTEERMAFQVCFELPVGGAAEGKRERGGVRPRECHAAWDGVMVPGPNQLSGLGLLRGLPLLEFESNLVCAPCHHGKMIAASHSPVNIVMTEQPRELLHMDISVPLGFALWEASCMCLSLFMTIPVTLGFSFWKARI
jgi:hypothetical protein